MNNVIEKIYNNDYYSLSKQQRDDLQNFYLSKIEKGDKIDPPFFMTQREIIEKEEKKENKTVKAIKKAKIPTKNKIILEEIDRIKLENFQLKLELVKKTYFELKLKEKEILNMQNIFAKQIEDKYLIKLENYNIDLTSGICKRN